MKYFGGLGQNNTLLFGVSQYDNITGLPVKITLLFVTLMEKNLAKKTLNPDIKLIQLYSSLLKFGTLDLFIVVIMCWNFISD